MSRQTINGDIMAFCSQMDVLTIDARRLQIPTSGVRGKAWAREAKQAAIGGREMEAAGVDLICPPQAHLSHAQRDERADGSCTKGDVAIEIRLRPEQKQVADATIVLEAPAIAVPLGYFLFCLALAVSNLLVPSLSQIACAVFSPLVILCILLHAAGLQLLVVSVGLVVCACFMPAVCVAWSTPVGVGFLMCVVTLVIVESRRVIPAISWLFVAGASVLAIYPQWIGLESKFWLTVAAFFSALACASAYVGGGKIIYKIKSRV